MNSSSVLDNVSTGIEALDIGFRVAQEFVNLGIGGPEYDENIAEFEIAIGNMDWLYESGQMALDDFKHFLPEDSAFRELEKAYEEARPKFREFLTLVQKMPTRLPLPIRVLILRPYAHHRRIMEKLEALRESWSAFLSAIDRPGTALYEKIRTSLSTMPRNDPTRSAIKALLDENLLQAATRLFDNARQCDPLSGSPFIPSTTSEGQAITQTNAAVCGLLQFEAMSDRASSIAEEFPRSFDWVFDGRDGIPTNLSEWLQHGHGIYLIAGSEGSGKSTLMKYIWKAPRTDELLKDWSTSGTSSLVIAAYFFWRSGTQLQRSEEGLLRSLIYSVLRERPEFAPNVLPREWATTFDSFLHGSVDSVSGLTAWKLNDLREAFKALFDLPINILFIVDGLDEYQKNRDSMIYTGMIRNLTEACVRSKNVKILASSRPIDALKTLGITTNMTLHEANKEMINCYLVDALKNDPQFKASETNDNFDGQELIDYLLITAHGSFLWAELAAKIAKRQLSKGSTLRKFHQERNTRLPEGLPGIYQQILSEMDDEHKKEASEILQIVLAGWSLDSSPSDSRGGMRLVDLTYAIGDSAKAIKMLRLPWSVDMVRKDARDCQEIVDKFIMACPDFIRLHSETDIVSTRIEFCHRSVLDFLESEDATKLLDDNPPRKKFCPYISHLKSAVQHLKILPNRQHKNPRPLLWSFVKSALLAANRVDSRDSAKFNDYRSLLNTLDRTMQDHHETICKEHGPSSKNQSGYLESRIRDADGTVEWRDRGRDYKRIAKMHWSNFHYDHKCSHPRAWQDSFLSLAVQFGLKNYVDQVLKESTWTEVIKKGRLPQATNFNPYQFIKTGRPLLNYALAPSPIAPYALITPDLVETLLHHGANVRQKFEKRSCWENALRWQYETYVEVGATSSQGFDQERDLAESRAKIFLHLLLKKGVNRKVSIETSRGLRIPAKAVVERSFKILESEPTYQELIDCFRSKA